MLSGKNGSKRLYNKVIFSVFMLLIIGSLFACSKGEAPVEESESYILEINDEGIPTSEIMVYTYQVIEEFQNIGGEEVWEFEDFSGGKSATEVAKDAIIENIIRMKVLNEKSVELDIVLTEEEEERVKKQAIDYLNEMSEEFIITHNITLGLLEELFYEFAVGKKVIDDITNDYVPLDDLVESKMLENPEYSRLVSYESIDLLTEYSVSHILIQTREKDQSGVYVMLTDDEKELQYNLALEIYERAKIGEDFDSLMNNYSEETFEVDSEENGSYEFSKALLPIQFKEGLVDLGIGEVSEVIESEAGYHIFKVKDIKMPSEDEIVSFEENLIQYFDNLENSVIGDLKKEAFNELYLKWKESVNISIDREAWDLIDLRI